MRRRTRTRERGRRYSRGGSGATGPAPPAATSSSFEILELSDTAYDERELPDSPTLRASRSGWRAVGMHHLDAVRRADGTWLAVVDGATLAEF